MAPQTFYSMSFHSFILRDLGLTHISVFLRDQWAQLPDFVEDLTGKTVVVVGANVGLGYEGQTFQSISSRLAIDWMISGKEVCEDESR